MAAPHRRRHRRHRAAVRGGAAIAARRRGVERGQPATTSPGCFGRENTGTAAAGPLPSCSSRKDPRTTNRRARGRHRSDRARQRRGKAPDDARARNDPMRSRVQVRRHMRGRDPRHAGRERNDPGRVGMARQLRTHALRWRSRPPRTRLEKRPIAQRPLSGTGSRRWRARDWTPGTSPPEWGDTAVRGRSVHRAVPPGDRRTTFRSLTLLSRSSTNRSRRSTGGARTRSATLFTPRRAVNRPRMDSNHPLRVFTTTRRCMDAGGSKIRPWQAATGRPCGIGVKRSRGLTSGHPGTPHISPPRSRSRLPGGSTICCPSLRDTGRLTHRA